MDISVECYEAHVPEWASVELDRLYGNIFSSLVHFRMCGGLEQVHTYVRRSGIDGKVLAIFLFRIQHGSIAVLNEGMMLQTEEIEHFSAYIFDRYPSIAVIEFHAVHMPPRRVTRPMQRFYQTEDFVLALPDSTKGYLAMLGNATRKNIKKHLNRWHRDFPDTEYRVYKKSDISEADLRSVVDLNHRRMAMKNKVSAIDEDELQSMLRMAQECGYLCVVRNQDGICAGTLLFRFGEHFVSRVSAHHPRFDDYRLGTLACFRAVCEAIHQGGRHFHFMWGRYAYKSALGSVLIELHHIVIYRSYWHVLRHAKLAVLMAYGGYRREAKMWLLEQSKKNSGWMPRMVNAGVNTMRSWKRLRSHEAA